MNQPLDPEVFLLAAEFLETQDDFACCAINKVATDFLDFYDRRRHKLFFCDLMGNSIAALHISSIFGDLTPEHTQERIFALCFAACFVEAGITRLDQL